MAPIIFLSFVKVSRENSPKQRTATPLAAAESAFLVWPSHLLCKWMIRIWSVETENVDSSSLENDNFSSGFGVVFFFSWGWGRGIGGAPAMFFQNVFFSSISSNNAATEAVLVLH